MDRRHFLAGIFAIVLYSLALNLPFLWEREFQGEAARRVVAALEMMERGEYLIPYIEGRPYLLKPPGYNWVLIGFFKVFGSHTEFVARLSSVTTATLAALFLALVFRAAARPPGLLWILPGLIFLSTPEVLDKACRAEIDMTYTFLLTLAVFGWFYFHEIRGKPYLAWGLGLFFTSLATLTKTFQALAFFYTSVIPYLFLSRRVKDFFSGAHFIGLLVYVGIFSLWFLPVIQKVGIEPLLRAWFGEYLAKKIPLEPSGFWGHFLGFPLEYVEGYLPWIIFLGLWIKRSFLKELPSPAKSLAIFSSLYLVFTFPLYWLLPGTRLRYILPTSGSLALLVAIPINFLLIKRSIPTWLHWSLRGLVGGIGIGLPFFIFLSWHRLFLYENPLSLLFLGLLEITIISYVFCKEPRKQIMLLFLFLLLSKISFASIYFTYQEKHRSHYRAAANRLRALLPPNIILCDYGINTPHTTYYLKYKAKWIKDIYLISGKSEFNKCDYIISRRKFEVPNAKFIKKIKARKSTFYLYKVSETFLYK